MCFVTRPERPVVNGRNPTRFSDLPGRQHSIGLTKAKSEDSNGRSAFLGKLKDSHNPSEVTLEAPVSDCLFALPASRGEWNAAFHLGSWRFLPGMSENEDWIFSAAGKF